MRRRTMLRPCVAENFTTTCCHFPNPVLLRILRLAAISLASGARFRYRWVPSELCPSDEASRWCGREQEVLEESRREPKFTSERRSPQHGTPQRSGEWVRATRRARRAAQDHPAELANLWNLCRSRGEHGLDTKPPRAGKREGNDFAHMSAALCGMDEVVSPEPDEPFDADVCRDGRDSVLRPSLLQGFAVGNRSDSPCVSLPLSPRLGPVFPKRRGPNQKGPEGLGTPTARELKGPAAVDPSSPSHRSSTSTATSRCQRQRSWPPMRICVQERSGRWRQLGSATPGSAGALRPMGPALVPLRRRDCEQNPAARRHNHIGLVKPPVAGTAGQPDCQDSKEGRITVLLHNRCVAQGIARCGSKAAGGVLRHHAAQGRASTGRYTAGQSMRSRSGERWLASTSLRRFEKSARLSHLVADLPARALAKIQEHARKVPASLMPAGLSERDLKRAPPKPLQRDAVAARTSKRSRAARPWC